MKEPTHCFNHILDLVLIYHIKPDHLLPLNSLLSDHYLITFEFNILDATMNNEKCYHSRCLSENTVNKFNEAFVSHLPTAEYGRTIGRDDLKFTSDIDCLVKKVATC